MALDVSLGKYDQVFDHMLEGLFNKSPLIERGSLGCAFVDIYGVEKIYGGEDGIVSALLGAVESYLGPRVGLANSKFHAFIAALNSNPGRSVKVPNRIADFLRNLPVDLLPFSWEDRVRLHDFGLQTIGQIAALSVGSMQAQFGIRGRVAWELANGIDKRPLIPSNYKETIADYIEFPIPATSNSNDLFLDIIKFNPYVNNSQFSLPKNFFFIASNSPSPVFNINKSPSERSSAFRMMRPSGINPMLYPCLLYTSDAADE